jgi:uncharacterized membrane protein
MPNATQQSTPGNLVEDTVVEVSELELQERAKQSRAERAASIVTDWTGTVPFAALNAVWFVVWIALNLPGSPLEFDPFPFSFLTMVVSLEAIFLAIFVLISENAAARASDRRARLDMQVNVIAEREITKVVEMVAAIYDHLGLQADDDEELEAMRRRTQIGHVAAIVDAADQKQPAEQ